MINMPTRCSIIIPSHSLGKLGFDVGFELGGGTPDQVKSSVGFVITTKDMANPAAKVSLYFKKWVVFVFCFPLFFIATNNIGFFLAVNLIVLAFFQSVAGFAFGFNLNGFFGQIFATLGIKCFAVSFSIFFVFCIAALFALGIKPTAIMPVLWKIRQ